MKDVILGVLLLVLMGWFVVGLANAEQRDVDRRCVEQFGQGWDGKTSRGPDICVNDKGEGKYLK